MARLGSDAPLVGRAEQLAHLTGGLERARAGHPAVVLLGGDAGVGKTRLLTEFSTRAEESGARVLLGHCVDLGSVGLPYLPFVEVLQQIAESAQLVLPLQERPGLSPLVPNASSDPGSAPAPGDVAQLQLFDAVSNLLGDLSADRPLVLILEDVHWADQSTRNMLSFLVARLRTEKVLLIASYRADDLHRRHPLRPLLAELVRTPVVERLDLPVFTPAEMREYLQVLQGGPVPNDVVRRILERSEGNAFFAEELLAAGAGTRSSLPTGLADILLARLELLSPAVQEIARIAAVAGRRVNHALLHAASSTPAGELEDALREAVTHHVFVAEGTDRYAFRHALLQEAVYADLLPGERVRLHAAYAKALTAEGAEALGSAAELAYHCRESQDLPGALAASMRAAHEAHKLRAPSEVLGHLEQALSLWSAVPNAATLADCGYVTLNLKAAAAASRAGEFARAVALATAARDAADPERDPVLAAFARQKLAYHLFGADRPDQAFEESTAGLALLPDDVPSPERVWLTATRARAALNLGLSDDARACAEAAYADGCALGLADAEADALTTLALLDERGGDVESGRKRLSEAVERAVISCDLAVEFRAAFNLASNRYHAGQLGEALDVLDAAVERASKKGLVSSVYGLELRVLQVIGRYLAGEWDGSLLAADFGTERTPDGLMARLWSARLYVEVGRGLPVAAERIQDLKDDWAADGQIALIAGGCEADALLWAGRPDQAQVAADEAIDWLRKAWGEYSLGGIWLAALGLAAAADRAEAARLARDDAAEVAAIVDGRRLVEYARATAAHGIPRGGTMGPEGRGWLARVAAEESRLRGETDPELWQAAADVFSFGYPYEEARSRWRLAEALLLADRRDEAAEELRQAHEVAVRLGAKPLADAVLALARRGRLGAAVGGGDQPVDDIALTARERDVLALLARGRTNRQIGQELFISEKTASVHVSNIIGKLGASGRTEAVAIASRRGLLTADPGPRPPRRSRPRAS